MILQVMNMMLHYTLILLYWYWLIDINFLIMKINMNSFTGEHFICLIIQNYIN